MKNPARILTLRFVRVFAPLLLLSPLFTYEEARVRRLSGVPACLRETHLSPPSLAPQRVPPAAAEEVDPDVSERAGFPDSRAAVCPSPSGTVRGIHTRFAGCRLILEGFRIALRLEDT